MHGNSWRHAAAGLTVALATVMAATVLTSAQAVGSGGRAQIEWVDSSVRSAGANLNPCSEGRAAMCIADTWWVTADGQRVMGAPMARVEGDGWLYRYTAGGVDETLWLTLSRTPDPSPNGYILVPAFIRKVQAEPYRLASDCTRVPARPDISWCVTEMPLDVRIGLTIHSDYASTGWIDGRLSEPEVSVTPARDQRPHTLTVEAAPLRVPTLTQTLWYDDTQDRADWSRIVELSNTPWGDGAGLGPLKDWSATPDSDRFFAPFPSITPMLFSQLSRALAPRLDQATGWVNLWRAEAWFLSEPPAFESCWNGSGGLMGVTSSNALTYKRELVFDDFTRQLFFTMAGPTRDAEGKRMTGDFYSMMTEEAITCFWGDAGPQSQVRIEVTNEEGIEVPATVSVDKRNGDVYLRATGFGFSLKKATISEVRKGAPAAPRAVSAVAQGSAVIVTWKATKRAAYRVRLSPQRFGEQPVIVDIPAGRKGTTTFSGRSPGEYSVDVIAVKGKMQSQVSTVAVSVG